MFLRILKKDIKRKKTMNIILLMFVILSVMFASSSVNNMVTVSRGIDYYFEKAGMTDCYIFVQEPDETNTLSKVLDKEKSVISYKKEPVLMLTSDDLFQNGKKMSDFIGAAFIISVDEAKLNYFDIKNNIIDNVERGKVYISGDLPYQANLEIGDSFEIKLGETELELEYAGKFKDASASGIKLLVNNDDYEKLLKEKKVSDAAYFIDTNDIDAIQEATMDFGTVFTKELMKTEFFMDMLVAGMLLIFGVCLILISFVVLRFTIGFTISEEFREIGIMKALGLGNNSIRGLYLVKYLGISVIGAVIGYFAGVPFGNVLLASVSENMVLGNDNTVIIGILSSIAVVAVIMMFCWSCTKKIKKLSPVDAVRSGQTGERFRKKSLLHLGKSKLGTTGFLSLNDVLSSPKQYGIITAVFSICLLLVMILANTANTIKGDQVLYLFGTTKSDVYYLGDTKSVEKVMRGEMTYKEVLDNIEKTLEKNNMPGKVITEEFYQIPISHGDKQFGLTFQICKGTKASDYTYFEGTAPMHENEIALASPVAKRLEAEVGDTVKLTINGEEKDYTLTALYQSLYNMGEIGRLHESVDVPNNESFGCMAYQIDFNDNPDNKEIKNRVEKLKDIFGNEQIYDLKDYCRDSTGIVEIVNSVKYLVLTISIIIIIMISVLMERSFISKEKAEIALMKAMGFKSSSIIAHHTVRFCIVSLISSVISIILCIPLTNLMINPVFASLGVENGISYTINPVEIFAVYPVIILIATLIGAFMTAIYTKTIKASDTASIE